MSHRAEAKQLRSFGVVVGGAFGVIALWPLLFRAESPRLWALVLAAVLIGLGLILPRSLALPYRLWMRIGHTLGWINTRIILGVAYYGLVTPLGVLMRLLGRDPMRRIFTPETDTYRVLRSPRPPDHLRRQF
jgi:hypothetical protein